MIRRTIATTLLLAAGIGSTLAQSVNVPNGSFESPSTGYVSTVIHTWQRTPKPDWYIEDEVFTWNSLTGIFKNTPPGSFDHLDNVHGAQALWLFNLPECGLFQDGFGATFKVGKTYFLTIGVCGRGGPLPDGSTLELSFYHRDGSVKNIVAATTVVHTPEAFPNHTHFFDYSVQVPLVEGKEAWANKDIGIQFRSTIPYSEVEDGYGGYWDLDNVRLVELPPDLQYSKVGGDMRVSWPSAIGFQYQLKVSENLLTWTDFGSSVAGTDGEIVRLYPLAGHDRAFFRVVATLLP